MSELKIKFVGVLTIGAAALLASCGGQDRGLIEAEPAAVTVEFNFDHRPLPEIPLPNDIATRPDPSSATGLRVNASMLAPTGMERRVRGLLDSLDGWGMQMPISIPFTGPIDIDSVLAGHRDVDYDPSNDVIYLVNIDRDSPEFGELVYLDVGNGNYPVILENRTKYGPNDPRGDTISLEFEEVDEDRNGNGKLDYPERDDNRDGKVDPSEDKNGNGYLDPPEDSDADGVLDKPNYLPGHSPAADDAAGRADALMYFYERETNTLVVVPMTPLRERTTYAVIVTKRLKDAKGDPVGSPFDYAHHIAQTEALRPALEVLPEGLSASDIAFMFSFTTQTAESGWVAVRDGLYGEGVQAHIASEFPAELGPFMPLKDADHPAFDGRSPYVLYNEEWKVPLAIVAQQFLGADLKSEQGKSLIDSHNYVDFHVMGSYESPQLFMREDGGGEPLSLELQSWPQDLDRLPVKLRSESVYYWLVVPRKEVSIRGQGKQAPIVLLGHGYGSNRVGETIGFAGFLAEFGLATLVIDNVSHGLNLSPDELDQARSLLANSGLGPLVDAINRGRAVDLDGDGTPDSGADFWTSYLFHTRDMMRQSALDYAQLIRIVRSFDGERRWDKDINQDGEPDLAGDFDGDGVLDIGADSPIFAFGGSLGGIMATILGGAEPEVSAIAPIAGGGRLVGVGTRSLQGGIPQAVMMRVMGPVFHATLGADGKTAVGTYVTELNGDADLPLAVVDGLLPGDTMIAENLETGEVGCGYLLPDTTDDAVAARARVSLATDVDDLLEIRFYRGPALVAGDTECALLDGFEPIATVDEREFEATFLGEVYPPGELRSFVEGLGLRRANPELRRFMGLGQMVLDPADPSVFARHFANDPLEFATGKSEDTPALIITTVGDMNVPASGGVTVGRAAGYIDFLRPDPRYVGTPYEGMPANEILLATYTAEAVNTLRRFTYNGDPAAGGVHMDVEDFSNGTDLWGDSIPRLDPPLRLVADVDADGATIDGYSGAIFTYAVPEGQHGFALPGELTDQAVAACADAGGMDCGALVGETFDVGWYMFHMIGGFMRDRGAEYPILERCNFKEECNDLPPTPADRADPAAG
ncbi:MAG: hypothetical protein H6710_17475 [Myxococcales bacterium]|nr:hypothetical protein [Myxococcales bacterium]